MRQIAQEGLATAFVETPTIAAEVAAQKPFYQIAADRLKQGATLTEIIAQMREAAIDDGIITHALRAALHRTLSPQVSAQEINATVQQQVAEAFRTVGH